MSHDRPDNKPPSGPECYTYPCEHARTLGREAVTSAEALLSYLRKEVGDEHAFAVMGAFYEYLRQRAQDVLALGHAAPFGIDVTGPKSHEWAQAYEALREDLVQTVERAS